MSFLLEILFLQGPSWWLNALTATPGYRVLVEWTGPSGWKAAGARKLDGCCLKPTDRILLSWSFSRPHYHTRPPLPALTPHSHPAPPPKYLFLHTHNVVNPCPQLVQHYRDSGIHVFASRFAIFDVFIALALLSGGVTSSRVVWCHESCV
jgi:hypothetical protein